MKFSLELYKRALADIQEAIDYYENQQPGLGDKFLKSIEKGLQSIHVNPYFQKRYDQVRCLPLHKFPFMIHYLIDEPSKTAYIMAIIHCSADPQKWPQV